MTFADEVRFDEILVTFEEIVEGTVPDIVGYYSFVVFAMAAVASVCNYFVALGLDWHVETYHSSHDHVASEAPIGDQLGLDAEILKVIDVG